MAGSRNDSELDETGNGLLSDRTISSDHGHSHSEDSSKCSKNIASKECRIIFMLSLVLSYFFVEIFVGFLNNSLALVADACHMLSDGLCLVVALVAIKISKKSVDAKVLSEKNTFGWSRSEILGSLINAVFLLALCVILILESIEKFIQPEPVENPLLVLYVGLGGLVMNIVGLMIFCGDGTGHGHSHSGGGHGHSHATDDGNLHVEMDMAKSAAALNMRGIFLHVAGDFFGSVVVCLSALLMYFFNNCNDESLENCNYHAEAVESGEFLLSTGLTEDAIETMFTSSNISSSSTYLSLMFPNGPKHWTLYVDPATSFLLTMLILYTTLKLLRVPVMILMQTVPRGIDMEKIKEDVCSTIRSKYNAIVKIHDLHIWTLAGDQIVGTVHLKMLNVDLQNFNQIVSEARQIFHKNGIHHLTIQPELSTNDTSLTETSSNGDSNVLTYEDNKSEECLLICCDEGRNCDGKS
ncbi:Oidioi.mRNA.OKI2018_I69.chr2.g3967.t1.cds [Oikopleura dioica]|uniref:Oidioi.mRNA.OKI2018_I69.chr2.g3967.t1.cds n=1 Tax=Oikopleura dioica TaxID=34765 RepID=A0ABN7SVI0_OIKDI|nr:Oidioi.mRNA.OKI2018_I69.chr2.g3967.t1.cds [Oikopleura dioica]